MEDGNEKYDVSCKTETEREEIFSRAIRAGKRTYFFDVKSTRRNDYYLTITESKKRFNRDGKFFYEKHKIFLYKEDFDKFLEGLNESVDFIKNSHSESTPSEGTAEENQTDNYTDVDFEDLDDKNENE